MFQSTHPRGVRLCRRNIITRGRGFNPRTHVGCDVQRGRTLTLCQVSIHAPTWGATYWTCTHTQDIYVSIHAPTWGATLPTKHNNMWHKFQSTHPRGVRLFVPWSDVCPYYVSIHAPTWGATLIQLMFLLSREFQSTHPRGVRRPLGILTVLTAKVSIHAPTWGATNFLPVVSETRSVSIHAPTWGATRACEAHE